MIFFSFYNVTILVDFFYIPLKLVKKRRRNVGKITHFARFYVCDVKTKVDDKTV